MTRRASTTKITTAGAGPVLVIGGVDTHKDTHTAAAIDQAGRVLGTAQFPPPRPATGLLAWLRGFGRLELAGVEGTGAYGAGLSRYLHDRGVAVVEIDRPDRKTRRSQGKSDPIDAEAAARAALAGRRTGTPKFRDGRVEALRPCESPAAARSTQRADVTRQIKTLIITAAEGVRTMLRDLKDKDLTDHLRRIPARPDQARRPHHRDEDRPALPRPPPPRPGPGDRRAGRTHQPPVTQEINPALTALNGVGPDVAGQLLVTAGDNPDRLRSEAAFAMLCGVAPLPASSGRTHRHRLNRGGDRPANAALYRIVLCRLRWDPRTRTYMERRTKEGLSKKEIIRCLKRYIAREIYRALPRLHLNDLASAA